MSLIICSECGKEISDKATVCIHCGCPIKKDENIHTSKKIYMCMSGACLSNPFKEFNEYDENVCVCPDCGGQLEYYETEIIDNNTDLVVERYIEESQKNMNGNYLAEKTNSSGREIYGMKPRIECPYCHSTDTKKISGFSKAVEVGLLGILAMDRAGKQWHCNHCGSDF